MSPWLAVSVLSRALRRLAAAQSADWPTERPPQPLPARDIKFPPYEIQTLPNGLQVVVGAASRAAGGDHAAAGARRHARRIRSEKLGLAHLAASLLDQGTTTKSAEQMNDAIDFIGGAMGAGAGTDLTFVNMVVMKDSFDAGLRMLSDMARQPAFAPAEIERQRQQMLSGLQVSLEDPEYIANSVFDRLVYGFHPYGMPENGTPETIGGAHARRSGRVPHAVLRAEQRDPRDCRRRDRARKRSRRRRRCSATGQKRDLPAQTFIDPPDPTRRVIVVNKPDAVQTEVRVGHIGIPRKHPDYMAVNLAIRILGGEGSNRLHQVLRTERGLTYGAQANMDTLKESGDFEAETNTRSDATGEVLRLIVDEFWRLQRERVGERELDGAKAYLTGSFPLTIETPEAIAMQVVNVLFYGLPLEELQTFRERVNAVTRRRHPARRAALLRPDRLSVVLVGNAAAFASQLRGVGFGTFETVELADLDLTAANFKRDDGQGAGGGRDGQDGQDGQVGQVRAGSVAQAFRRLPISRRRWRAGRRTARRLRRARRRRRCSTRSIAAKGGLEKLRGLKIDRRQADAGEPAPGRRVDGRDDQLHRVSRITSASRRRRAGAGVRRHARRG